MSDVTPILAKIEQKQLRTKMHPDFKVGDTIKVMVLIKEGEKEREQAFEGVVIKKQNGGAHPIYRQPVKIEFPHPAYQPIGHEVKR